MKYITLLVCLSLSSCCWMSKRSCFPPCPPPKIITLNRCKLPKDPRLPKVIPSISGCPTNKVCFDRDNSINLFMRDKELRDWVKKVKDLCSIPSDASITPPTDAGVGD